MDGWGVLALVAEAERALVERARRGVEPTTYTCLAEEIGVAAAPPHDVRVVALVLHAMRGPAGSWPWSGQLTAFVVDPATGQPGESYFLARFGEPDRVREVVHERLVSGLYDPDDVL